MNYQVHPSAIIDDGAQIGQGSPNWHFAHVCGVTVGEFAFVGAGAVVNQEAIIAGISPGQ